jgi:ABC-type antimicrobial peptide transport system permease subunit
MAAMGASRSRLLSRSFAEVAVLGAGGCVAALFVARGVVATLIAIQPQQLPRLSSIHLDGPVFLFAFAVGLIIIAAITLLSAASIATRNP